MLLGVLPLPSATLPAGGWLFDWIVATFLWINIFWGVINLLPVFPLDGGNIARTLLVHSDPWNGVRKSLRLSMAVGAVVAAVGLIFLASPFLALLFGYLAFTSYMALRGGGIAV
jgi:membrane-associated protease RseP (regulator of RpoE activity)